MSNKKIPTAQVADRRNSDAKRALRESIAMLGDYGFLDKEDIDSLSKKVNNWVADFYVKECGYSDSLPFTFESGRNIKAIRNGEIFSGVAFIDDWLYDGYESERPAWKVHAQGSDVDLFSFDCWLVEKVVQ